MKFRNYQEEAIRKVINSFLNNNKNIAVVWPQGTGKTLVGLEVARKYLELNGNNKKVLVTFRNRNVKETWIEHIIKCGYKDLHFTSMIALDSWLRRKLWNKVQNVIITSETLARDIDRRVVNLEDFDLIIVDEATKLVAECFDGYRWSLPFRFFQHLNGNNVLLLVPNSCEAKRLKKILDLMEAEVLDISEESESELEEATPKTETEVIKIKDELVSYIDRRIKKFCSFNYYQITKRTGIDFSKEPNTFFWREKINEFARKLPENEVGKLFYNFKVIEELNSARFFLFHNKLDSLFKRLQNALQRTRDYKYPKLLKHLIQLVPQIRERKLEKAIELTLDSIKNNKRVIIYTPFRSIARKLQNKFVNLNISCDLILGGIKVDTDTSAKVLVMNSAGGESLNLPQFNVTIFISFPRKSHTRKQISGRMRGGKEILLVYEDTTEDRKIELTKNGDENTGFAF
jgi:ERCC4-related helicase